MSDNTNYNPNIPKAKDVFGPSQLPILDNFMDLYTSFAVNHVALDASSGAGNHTILELLEQTGQFQTNSGEISLYSKEIPSQTDQIYLRNQGNQPEFQYTTYQIYPLFDVAHPPTDNIPYFTFLPNNILVYFGVLTYNKTQPGQSAQPTIFNFKPNVVKNVIGYNFCVMGTTPGFPPTVSLIWDTTSTYITGLSIFAGSTGRPTVPFKYAYYIITGLDP